ncbi:GntR family transcriptional regulator [Streptomyces sp. RS2]|uniref:GntR family transcriptional regulator n=1 Tax=Streptomyces sp. RS2 TaxID=1451205 RepID=UPI0021F8DD35|nr:GntR family transcriptional regulator [Streptomyces sp. RS2]MCW1100124.1 GntR family transcriptional regulator [Streptomyces sp. RS2]
MPASQDRQQGSPLSMSHVMYDRLQARIMSSDIAPGERLTVEALAREFDVSPTPIREALSRLEADGLVRKTHLRGFHVAPQLSEAEFEAMFEVRTLLEPYAAGRTARLATTVQKARIAELNQRMAEVDRSVSEDSYREFALLDSRFHSLIAQASGNPIVRDTFDRMHVHVHLFRMQTDWRIADLALTEHHTIVAAIEEHDEILAAAAMHSHLAKSLARLKGRFANDQEVPR